jgi:hypothetical protein
MACKKAKPFNSLGGIWHSERGVSSLCTFLTDQVSRVRQLLKEIGGPASASGVIPEINEHQTLLFSEIWMRFPASAFDALQTRSARFEVFGFWWSRNVARWL